MTSPDDRAALTDLEQVYEAFGIGSQARTMGTLLENIRNSKRRSACLSAIEREFFTIKVPSDEPEDEGVPHEECLLSWGSNPDAYVEQFRDALSTYKSRHVAEHSAIYISKRLTGSDADAPFVQVHINQAVSEAMEAAASQPQPVNRADGDALRHEQIAHALHWPDHWDIAAYPTVESALTEVFAAFECQECGRADGDAAGLTRYRVNLDTGTDTPDECGGYFRDGDVLARMDDLRMLIQRLAHSLRKASPDNALSGQAMDYLKRVGMTGSIVRADGDAVPVATVHVTSKGYAMRLSTYVAYALPEGKHDLYATPPASTSADARNAVIEECARFIEGGSFLHDNSPPAQFARECAAEMRKQLLAAPIASALPAQDGEPK